ncbi:hypothetical protein EC973_003243 [Apophysomyces ossiformis]|uniref:Uncharacterized protein n=1 Tax=Apophysomyces ossiformis TaxID=679940 RepID=A0A8H7BY47_9FUNG|nr:hypothetical protein EC973_003243 [Apophysomyces ossiformis]
MDIARYLESVGVKHAISPVQEPALVVIDDFSGFFEQEPDIMSRQLDSVIQNIKALCKAGFLVLVSSRGTYAYMPGIKAGWNANQKFYEERWIPYMDVRLLMSKLMNGEVQCNILKAKDVVRDTRDYAQC